MNISQIEANTIFVLAQQLFKRIKEEFDFSYTHDQIRLPFEINLFNYDMRKEFNLDDSFDCLKCAYERQSKGLRISLSDEILKLCDERIVSGEIVCEQIIL